MTNPEIAELRTNIEVLVAMLERLFWDPAGAAVRDHLKDIGRTAAQVAGTARQLEELLRGGGQ